MNNDVNKKISEILKNIINEYHSLNEFARKCDISSAYISKLINLKYQNPPSPSILKKIAENSKDIITYEELMRICGYFTGKVKNSLLNSTHYVPIPVFSDIEDIVKYDTIKKECNNDSEILQNSFKYQYHRLKLKDDINNYFAYTISSNEMAPLLDVDDIAIIYRCNDIENGKTYLIGYIDNIIIRKLIINDNNIELIAMNPYYPIIRTTKEEIEIIGKVVEAKISSAFK